MDDAEPAPRQWPTELSLGGADATAAYRSSGSPHSAIDKETFYKNLYGKEADLSLVKIIRERAVVHTETYTTKLGNNAWEGRLCV